MGAACDEGDGDGASRNVTQVNASNGDGISFSDVDGISSLSDENESSDNEDTPVLSLHCGTCDNCLTYRGQAVFLVKSA